jgi:transcriptional regulator with XRE-family HTH domain
MWRRLRACVRHIRYTQRVTAGRLLREGRRRHGLTQAQLAARARTSQAAISRIERDLVSPSVATLRTLLELMGEELVLDSRAIDYGHDRTLLRQNLERTPSEWIDAEYRVLSDEVRGSRQQ